MILCGNVFKVMSFSTRWEGDLLVGKDCVLVVSGH